MECFEKVEAVWQMAETSLHDDVFLNSKKRHQREAQCYSGHPDSLVGRVAGA